jgi:ATP-dependent DNA helicase RecQ
MHKQSKRSNKQKIRQIARERFGYKSFRAGQEAAIQALLDGHDTLAVMPTGSGKSAIYQIAGLLIPGSTVVISPLIALPPRVPAQLL